MSYKIKYKNNKNFNEIYRENVIMKHYPLIEKKRKNTSIKTIIFNNVLTPRDLKKANSVSISSNLRSGRSHIVTSKISGCSRRNSFTRQEIQHAYPLNKKNLTRLVKSLDYANEGIVDPIIKGVFNSYHNNIDKANAIEAEYINKESKKLSNNYLNESTGPISIKGSGNLNNKKLKKEKKAKKHKQSFHILSAEEKFRRVEKEHPENAWWSW